jgi:hypothetical protein
MSTELISISGHTLTTASLDMALYRLKYAADHGTRLDRRRAIQGLKETLESMPQVDQPLEHCFADGLYGRKRINPAGTLLVTLIHKQENISILAKGRMQIYTEDRVLTLDADQDGPMMFQTKPGTERVIFAQTECVFFTVNPNEDNTQDLDVLESRIIAKSFDEISFMVDSNTEVLSCLG